MIAESRPDYSTDGTVLRCINCGLVLDPLIEQNRLARTRSTHAAMHAAWQRVILSFGGVNDLHSVE
jgi:hypothetical protein